MFAESFCCRIEDLRNLRDVLGFNRLLSFIAPRIHGLLNRHVELDLSSFSSYVDLADFLDQKRSTMVALYIENGSQKALSMLGSALSRLGRADFRKRNPLLAEIPEELSYHKTRFVELLPDFPHLNILDLSFHECEDAPFSAFVNVYAHLYTCRSRGVNLFHLRKMKNIVSLDVAFFSDRMPRSSKLQHLNIPHCNIVDLGQHLSFYSDSLLSLGVSHLRLLEGVTWGTGWAFPFFDALGTLENLEHLDFSHNDLSNRNLFHKFASNFAKLKNLRTLNLENTLHINLDVVSFILNSLQEFPYLESLNLASNGLTYFHMVHLNIGAAQGGILGMVPQFKSLKSLNLSGNHGSLCSWMMPSIERAFRFSPSLRHINLSNTGLSIEDIQVIRESIPQINFVYA